MDNINNNNELFTTGINNMNIASKNKRINRYSDINENNTKNEIKNEIKIENENKNNNNEIIQDEDNKSKKSEGVGENIEPIEIGESRYAPSAHSFHAVINIIS